MIELVVYGCLGHCCDQVTRCLMAARSRDMTLAGPVTIRLTVSCNEIDFVHFDIPVPPHLAHNTVHLGGESWIEVTDVPSGSDR